MITFAVEPWSVYAPDAEELWPRHWEELAKNRDKIPLDVDYDRYEMADATGELFIAVGREAGKVAAYWIGFIKGHLHYNGTLHAFNDIYYVAPEHRKSGVGTELFVYVERELKRRGVKKIINATKISHDHSALFESQGFHATERVFTKYIGD